ncbi:MAG TPA: two-component regulator propeller domain-containing protein, partial [Sunxiuqinia sp.]|nr:two-component regulator propeller domain-containing protein [Sunxiuqinia sp.]
MKKIIVLIGVLWSGLAFSQDFVFEHISSNDGLSNNLVRDIIQDQEGYLWFATSGGLNRFDGHSFDIYKRSVGDTLSLSYSRMKSIFQDQNGFVWAISSLGNIHRINPIKREVDNFQEHNILPQGTSVHSYFIADNGDIWLLLNTGVLRVNYPTQTATKFRATYFDHNDGLPGDDVNFVYDDHHNNLWIGTNKGLVKMTIAGTDRSKTSIKKYFDDKQLPFTTVNQLDDKLYFGTGRHELIVYDLSSKQFNDDQKVSQQLHGGISCIIFNHKKEMLLGTDSGDLFYKDMKTGKSKYFPRLSEPNFDANLIGEIHSDSYGLFWVVTNKRGVYQFDPTKQRITYFDLIAKNRSFLGEGDRQTILEDSNHNLWVGVYGGGLFLFQRDSSRFRQFRHDPNNTNSISSDIVLSLYEDRSKNLWIGTSYGGINKISLKKEMLRRITPVKNPSTGFDNYIRATAIDAMGNIWVGSKAGKIYEYRNSKLIGVLPDDLYKSGQFPVTNMYSLYFDHDHNLWIGTKGSGLFVIKSLLKYDGDLGNKNIQILHFKNEPDSDNSLSSNNVYSILQDIHGQYWIGAFQGGLNLLTDPFDHPTFRRYTAEMEGTGKIVSDEVRYLFFDHNNNLWVGTSEGVSILENRYLKGDRKDFINLSPSIKDTNGMSGKVVYQIKQTQNNDIYLAMLDGGVNQLKASDFARRNFHWIHHNSQVLSPNVYSIEEDNTDNLWMGTDNGLYRMNIKDGVVERYRIKNSFLPLTFSESCSAKTMQNELVFGSNNGFVIFHPDSIKKDTTQFPIKFSGLEVNGERITNLNSDILSKSIDAQDHIQLKYSQNNIALHFAVLDYDKPDAIQYSYMLQGYDNDWSKASTNNLATYRKLPPGDYVLKVKGTNSGGSWIRQHATMSIHISPPFWKSNLGYAL